MGVGLALGGIGLALLLSSANCTAMAQSRTAMMACQHASLFRNSLKLPLYSFTALCSSLQLTETGHVQQVCSSGAWLLQRGVSGVGLVSVNAMGPHWNIWDIEGGCANKTDSSMNSSSSALHLASMV